MRSKPKSSERLTNRISFVTGLLITAVLCISYSARAQQSNPSPSPTNGTSSSSAAPADTGVGYGDYTVISSFEIGYRALSVGGDHNKYDSDLNYRAGPRLFDSSFFARSKEGKGGPFETFVVTSTGWGSDPHGTMRLSAESPKWYRFDANYRRFKYFRFLNNLANPNWVFNPANFSVAPNPVTGEHGYNTRTSMGDFDLSLLPNNRTIRFSIGYSPERYSGPAFTNYHFGGNEFNFQQKLKSLANDYRFGADGRLGPIDISFLQGFRRFRDDSSTDLGPTHGINLNPAAAQLNSFSRLEPTRGRINFTRFSAHTLVAKVLDITGRVIYSKSNTDFSFLEKSTGVNVNPRIGGWPPGPLAATPNILNLGQYNLTGNASRPNWLGDLGATYMATNKLRISNTFKVEDFKIDSSALFSDFFSLTRGSGSSLRTDTISFSNLDAHRLTKYRKYQDTIEGDYQFNARYAAHFGYRYGHRTIEESFEGFNLGSSGSVSPPPARTSEFESQTNNTHALLGGFKARPTNNWTIFFDAEHGTADNVFTRIGNYNYTNIRAKTRYTPSQHLSLNFAVITKNNANPSEIAGVSLSDFGVDIRSRTFTSAIDWTPNSRFTVNAGYNYNWANSDAVVDYFYNSVQHPQGHSLYFLRNNFIFIDTTTRFSNRVTLFAAYRINQDNGQGDRVANPTGTPGTLINSYPMSYQSPEMRLAFKVNRRLDWNFGYQYYNYNENAVVGPRPQNYHAHLPYMSLRVYIGRRE